MYSRRKRENFERPHISKQPFPMNSNPTYATASIFEYGVRQILFNNGKSETHG